MAIEVRTSDEGASADRRTNSGGAKPARARGGQAAEGQLERIPDRGIDPGGQSSSSRGGIEVTPRDLRRTLDVVTDRLQGISGLATELRRSVSVDVDKLVRLEGDLDRLVRLLVRLQPKLKTGDR